MCVNSVTFHYSSTVEEGLKFSGSWRLNRAEMNLSWLVSIDGRILGYTGSWNRRYPTLEMKKN
jgi:hypothetical protein